jgi:hypothetical protein
MDFDSCANDRPRERRNVGKVNESHAAGYRKHRAERKSYCFKDWPWGNANSCNLPGRERTSSCYALRALRDSVMCSAPCPPVPSRALPRPPVPSRAPRDVHFPRALRLLRAPGSDVPPGVIDTPTPGAYTQQ